MNFWVQGSHVSWTMPPTVLSTWIFSITMHPPSAHHLGPTKPASIIIASQDTMADNPQQEALRNAWAVNFSAGRKAMGCLNGWAPSTGKPRGFGFLVQRWSTPHGVIEISVVEFIKHLNLYKLRVLSFSVFSI